MNDLEAMRVRRSVRTFVPGPLPAEDLAGLERALAECSQGPFGTPVRFALIALDEAERGASRSLWTYGVIHGAGTYVAGAIDPGRPDAPFDFGHCLERVVLAATRRGLGTCWLGGTFRASVFAARMGLSEPLQIPCVTPVGRAAAKRKLVEHVFRAFAGADRRKPWAELFFEDDGRSALTPSSAGRFAEALECLRLAPSASNKQPWRVFRTSGGAAWHLGLARNPLYDRSVSPVSLQEIDLGIGASHFELACRALDLPGGLRREPGVALPGGAEYLATWR